MVDKWVNWWLRMATFSWDTLATCQETRRVYRQEEDGLLCTYCFIIYKWQSGIDHTNISQILPSCRLSRRKRCTGLCAFPGSDLICKHFICEGGFCLSFTSTWRILESSVGFPGFGPWTTTMEGCFLSCPFFPLFSIAGISPGMSSAIAFQ